MTDTAALRRWQLFAVCALTLAMAIEATAQVWVRRYDGPGGSNDVPQALQVDGTGHVYVTGFSSGYFMGIAGAITLKYDSTGEMVWQRQDSEGRGRSLEIADNGTVAVSGIAGAYSWRVCRFTRYGRDGGLLWQQEYPGTYTASRVAPDGGVVAACYHHDSASAGAMLVRFDSTGTLQWERTFPACYPEAVSFDASMNIFVVGDALDQTTYAVRKFDTLGHPLWARQYSGNSGPVPPSPRLPIWISDDGHAQIVFRRGFDMVTIKIDPLGAVIWERVYDGPSGGLDVSHSLAVDQAGNVYVAGTVQVTGSMSDIALLKYDVAGNLQWESFYDGRRGDDQTCGLRLDSTAHAYVIGESYGGTQSAKDYVTLRWNSAGERLWERRYDGPDHIDDVPLALGVYGDHMLYVTGKSFGATTESDYATIRYNACAVRVPGDINSDAIIGMSDIVHLVNYIYREAEAPVPCSAAGDLDCGGAVTARDLILLVNHIFKGGPPPCDVCNSALAISCP